MPDFTNQGFLSRNKFYEEGGNKPMYTGKGNVEGKEIELAAWLKEKDGRKYFSIKFSAVESGEENQDVPVPGDQAPF
jgi:hypothetical protein